MQRSNDCSVGAFVSMVQGLLQVLIGTVLAR
jgi:hypothetical protein